VCILTTGFRRPRPFVICQPAAVLCNANVAVAMALTSLTFCVKANGAGPLRIRGLRKSVGSASAVLSFDVARRPGRAASLPSVSYAQGSSRRGKRLKHAGEAWYRGGPGQLLGRHVVRVAQMLCRVASREQSRESATHE
jgi:hypothetical protein